MHDHSFVPDFQPAASRQGFRLRLDLPLLIALVLLCGYGLVVLYSATGRSEFQVERQIMRLAIAFAGMLVIAQISPSRLRRWSPALYAVAVVLLLAVMVAGVMGKGAQRWLDLGVIRFQPSEISKTAIPMMVAWWLAARPLPPSALRVLGAGVITAIPVLLIARQPDLGTALLVASAGVIVVFLAGLSWRIMAVLAVAAATSVPILWSVMRPYQRQRVLTFLDPQSDPLGSGYHIIQSQIAIGSGGVYGKGWLNGTQSHLEFLPERSTDFIFAVLGEEFGLLGIAVMLALYGFIVMRGLYIAAAARETYCKLLAGGMTLVFFVYLLVNTGMVVGLLPVVGVPLPLVSYGGTSAVTIMAGFGIIMSIHAHGRDR